MPLPTNVPGQPRITAADLARRLGVSRPTVSTILSGGKSNTRVSPELQNRIRKLAAELGYRPNGAARAMTSQCTRHIGVLMANTPSDPYTSNELYYTILGINDALEADGYITSLIRINDVGKQIKSQSRAVREVAVDGVVAMGAIPATLQPDIERLFGTVVWGDTSVRGPQRCLTRNEIGVGERVAREVLARGYERVLFVTREDPEHDPHYSHQDRATGLRRILDAAGIPVQEAQIYWEWSDRVRKAVCPHLRPGTAVVVSSAERVALVVRAGALLGQYPGRDFGLVCCDSSPNTLLTWPDLARMEYDRYAAGSVLAEMVLKLLASPARNVCPSRQLPLAWRKGATLPNRRKED